MMFPHVYKCTCTYAHTDGHVAHTRTHIPLATFVPLTTLRHTMHTHGAHALNTPSRRDCLTAIVLLLWSESQVRHCKDGKIRNAVGQPVTHPDGYS